MLSTMQTRRRDSPSRTETEDPFSWALDAREKETEGQRDPETGRKRKMYLEEG